MAWFHGGIAVPKPEPRKRVKRRKDRAEAKVKKSVRKLVAERDGFCRFGVNCAGISQWAHFGRYKRFKTRGLAPTTRHCTVGSLMLCGRHHRLYDAGQLKIEALTPDGCDGELRFRL